MGMGRQALDFRPRQSFLCSSILRFLSEPVAATHPQSAKDRPERVDLQRRGCARRICRGRVVDDGLGALTRITTSLKIGDRLCISDPRNLFSYLL